MAQFEDEKTAWRRPGATRIEIPPQLAQLLERTYKTGQVCNMEIVDADDQSTRDLVRAGRLYCERKGKRWAHQFATDEDGTNRIRFRMRDKRVYNKRTTTRSMR